jgi:hypothetical protein
MKVKDKDMGYAALVRRVFALDSPKVSIGIHEEDGAKEHDAGMTVVALAAIHEFGLGNVPERSFIRAWFDENEDRAKEALRRLLVSVVEGKRQPQQALSLFAQWALGEMQKRMAAGIPPALQPETIRKKTRAGKTGETPLIDTGQLRSSLSYEILDGDGNVTKTGKSRS